MFFRNNPTSVTEKAPKPHERDDYDVGEAIGKSEARHDKPKPVEKVHEVEKFTPTAQKPAQKDKK